MSMLAIIVIASGALAAAYIVWFFVAGFETLPETFERWHAQKHESKGPEAGTIRIVEKMDEDGAVYYIGEEWGENSYYCWDWYPLWGTDGEYLIKAATVEQCQEAIAAKAEKQRRAAYSKVMGEFKP